MANLTTMTSQDKTTNNDARFMPELLKQTGDFAKYERLAALEPAIDWLGYSAKLYIKSHRIASVSKRINGAWRFREYLQENADSLKLVQTDDKGKDKPLISQVFDQVTNAENGAKYKVFAKFAVWCDGIKGYKPNTTWGYVQSVKSLAKYCDTGVTNDGFKDHVTMPTTTALNDEEYPKNDQILRLADSCPPDLRRFLLYIIDTGAEPADVVRLHKDMIYFDETPVRVQYKRKKTSKAVTQFVNDHTANALKAQIEATKSDLALRRSSLLNSEDKIERSEDDGFVFVKVLKHRSYGRFYRAYSEVLKRAGMTDKIDGSKISKYHFKIFKKRLFTIAISAGIPEYVVQGMLGRKKYLDQYMALPLDQKREFATKILRKVSIYATEQDEQEKRKAVAEMLGLPELSADQMQALRGALFRLLEQPKHNITSESA